MIKILHTSDWHLGKKTDWFSRHREQVEVLDEICGIADSEGVHAVIVAGDLFDGFNPPAESVELFYKALKKLSDNGRRAVIAIAGNHDSPDRIEAPDPLARECGIIFAGYPATIVPEFRLDTGLEVARSREGFIEVKLPGTDLPLRIIQTPYANEYRLKTYLGEESDEKELRKLLEKRWDEIATGYCDDKGINLLVSHLFFMKEGGERPEEPEEEKPILHIGGAQAVWTSNLPANISYVALGHLHRQQVIDENPCPVIYSGSPLAYSFSEAGQKKYVIISEMEPGAKATYRKIELSRGKALKRLKFNNVQKAVEALKADPNCLVELTMVSDTYLTASERKQLTDAHPGIITIIPEVTNKEVQGENSRNIDLGKNISELFKDYFKYRNGNEPGESIMELFREVLGTKRES
jgi:DNA repair protein SbcD/Mre11